MAASPVTPTAGLASIVAAAGVAVEVVGSAPNGGFITNPVSAGDEGLANTEPLYVDPTGNTATLDALEGNGTTFALAPGQTWSIIPGQTTSTWVNATSTGHKFSVVVY